MDGLAQNAITNSTELFGSYIGAAAVDPPRRSSIADSRRQAADAMRNQFVDAMRELVSSVADRFAGIPGDASEIDDCIDLILADKGYHERFLRCASLLPWREVQRLKGRMTKLPAWIPEPTQDIMRLAYRAEHETVGAYIRMRNAMVDSDAATSVAEDGDPFAFVYTDSIPLRVRDAIVARHIADVCSIALRGLIGTSTDAALVEALASRWLDGTRKFLALLDALGFARADGEVLPRSLRFDRATVEREMHEAFDGLAYAMAKAESTGQPYPLARSGND